MRELKVLAVVAFFTALIYWGVEPFAHSQMHPHVAPADFAFKDLGANTKAGNAKTGADTFMSAGCTGCRNPPCTRSAPAPRWRRWLRQTGGAHPRTYPAALRARSGT